MKIVRNDRLWYGKYGGCFAFDAFRMQCDDFYKQYCKATDEDGFWDEYDRLKSEYVDTAFEFAVDGNDGLIVCKAPENTYSIIGHALLAKRLGKKRVQCGVRNVDEAALCARICAKLGLNLTMFLSRDISRISSLVRDIESYGVTIETRQCEELYNTPDMYAFQASLVLPPDESFVIHCRSNCGSYPQTNIATDFAKEYGTVLKETLESENTSGIERIVVPCVSGSFALSIFKAFEGSNVQLVSVECDSLPGLREEEDCFCGTFTKIMRNNTSDRILAPELADMFESGVVTRVAVSFEDAIKEKKAAQGKALLSLQSYAALNYCKAASNLPRTLCVVRRERWGDII